MRRDLFSTRLNSAKPSTTLMMSSKASAMKRDGLPVINLAVGEPDYDTPDIIKTSAHKAIDDGKTKYTDVTGIKLLREAICAKFLRENHLEYEPKQIIVSSGAKQTLFIGLFATINDGDEVIIPAPYWLSYIDMVMLTGGNPVIIECKVENKFKMTPKQLQQAITSRTKWLIINSPNNPTGIVYSHDELKAIGDVLLQNPHVYIISDDIYEHMIYDDLAFNTIAQVVPTLKDRTLTVNGVSKSYSMTGWRLGYGAGPDELINAMALVQSHSTSHPSSISQYAVVDALNGKQDFLLDNKKLLQHRRDLFLQHTYNMPLLHCNKPTGAFYMWVDCNEAIKKSGCKNSNEFCMYLLEKAMVMGAPGDAFGVDGYMRFSYTVCDEDIIEACSRVRKVCEMLN